VHSFHLWLNYVLKFAIATLQPQIVIPAAPPKPDGSGHEIKRTAGVTLK
jgi:hypothetical protein